MGTFKRYSLFIATNLLVVFTISIILNLIGAQKFLSSHGLNQSSLFLMCLVWGMAGSFVSLLLSKTLAKSAYNIKIIKPNTSDPTERKLIDMVHDLSKRAGIKRMPEVGYYQSEEVNAFATGPTKNRSLIAVSTALTHHMDEEQVEGVLAHEVAHVANGDMVTMTLIQGIVNAFAMFFSRILASIISNAISGKDRESRGFLYFALVQVLDIVLTLFGSIIVCWFSRHREYRADEGAAKLSTTGNIVSALEFLRTNYDVNAALTKQTPQKLRSMKIFGFRSKGLMYLFSTHPTLTSRIDKLKGAR